MSVRKTDREKFPRDGVEKPVSLAPLKMTDALAGLFAIPDHEATKPKRKKAPPAKTAAGERPEPETPE